MIHSRLPLIAIVLVTITAAPACRDTTGPPDYPGLTLTAVRSGYTGTCGLAADSTVFCWGGGLLGRVPDSIENACAAQYTTCVPLAHRAAGDHRFALLGAVAGERQLCALKASGQPYCWGSVGGWDYSNWSSVTPDSYPIGVQLVSVASGVWHTCGLDGSGVAYCWGANYSGELGRGGGFALVEATTSPAPVTGSFEFTQLAVGGFHTCGLLATGEALCWGDNFRGQLGVATAAIDSVCGTVRWESCSYAPVPVAGGFTFVALAAGADHTCGITAGGGLYCWGANQAGQLGTSDSVDTCMDRGPNHFPSIPCSRSPHATGLPAGVPNALVAGGAHTCALAGGKAFCWGSNADGQLGNSTALSSCSGVPCRPEPPAAAFATGAFVRLSAGSGHTCGIDVDGFAWCWGRNSSGQLGTGTLVSASRPMKVRAPL